MFIRSRHAGRRDHQPLDNSWLSELGKPAFTRAESDCVRFGQCCRRSRRSTQCNAPRETDHVSLAGLYGQPHSTRNRAVSRGALADRPEPAFASRANDDQRRRLRCRLVRESGRDSVSLSMCASGLERHQPARSRACRARAALRRAHPRRDWHARAGDELSSVSVWPLALHAQRPDTRLRARQARPDDVNRSSALRRVGRLDRFGSDVLSRADLRAPDGTGSGARTDGRRGGGGGTPAWRRASAEHDGVRDGR